MVKIIIALIAILVTGVGLVGGGVFLGVNANAQARVAFAYQEDFAVPYGWEYNTHWNVLGVIVREVDVYVTVAGTRQNVNITMDANDKAIATARFHDLVHFLNTRSRGQMTATLTLVTIYTPLRNMTPTWTHLGVGYAANGHQIKDLARNYVYDISHFDHVMAFIRSQCNDADVSVPTHWAGLYNGTVAGIHFSQVIFSGNRNCMWHNNIVFPERILVHEFMHGLEHAAEALGIDVPCIDAPRHTHGFGTTHIEAFRFYTHVMSTLTRHAFVR